MTNKIKQSKSKSVSMSDLVFSGAYLQLYLLLVKTRAGRDKIEMEQDWDEQDWDEQDWDERDVKTGQHRTRGQDVYLPVCLYNNKIR